MAEWDPYACNLPKKTGITLNPSPELREVHHVAHVSGARRIPEDGCIRSGLIYDESRLNKSRLCVSWVSANTWANGSIYGTVQFTFDWDTVLDDRNIYWVEVMTDYSPTAYRLLLTDRDLSKSKYVTPYDPAKDNGPLRRQKGKWYWNGEYTSEFMVEADLSLSDCTSLQFVKHHPNICRIRGSACTDKGATIDRTGGRVLAFILGAGSHHADHALLNEDETDLHFWGRGAITGLWGALARKEEWFSGGLKKGESRKAVLRGALSLYARDQREEARALSSLLSSQDVFETALAEIIAEHFGWDDYTLPD